MYMGPSAAAIHGDSSGSTSKQNGLLIGIKLFALSSSDRLPTVVGITPRKRGNLRFRGTVDAAIERSPRLSYNDCSLSRFFSESMKTATRSTKSQTPRVLRPTETIAYQA